MSLILDGHNNSPNLGGAAQSVTLTNTIPNAMIFVAIISDSGATVTAVSDTSGQGLVWQPRATVVNSTRQIAVWYVQAPTPFSGVTINVSFSTGCFNGLVAWAVGNENTVTPFDGSPVTSTTDPLSINTTNPNCFVYVASLNISALNPTAGSGWLLVDSPANTFMIVEYQIVSSPQSGLQGTFTTGAGGSTANVMDAIQAPPTNIIRLGSMKL